MQSFGHLFEEFGSPFRVGIKVVGRGRPRRQAMPSTNAFAGASLVEYMDSRQAGEQRRKKGADVMVGFRVALIEVFAENAHCQPSHP